MIPNSVVLSTYCAFYTEFYEIIMHLYGFGRIKFPALVTTYNYY